MGFFDSIKQALGFGPEDDNDIEFEGKDATVRPLSSRALPANADSSFHHDNRSLPDSDSDEDSARAAISEQPTRPDPTVIFERVVMVFNESLPGFLQKSVDPARQRQALFDALDDSMKDYFAQLDRNVERRLQTRFETDRRRLQSQIDNLNEKARKEEEENSNAKNLQLSAERQKRALSERVHDLEKQLATLEAENEQYILENKSMANKLRMAALGGDASDDAVAAELTKRDERIAELTKLAAETEQNLALTIKQKNEAEEQLRVASQQIEALKQEIDSKSAVEQDDVELLAKTQKENAKLKAAADEMLAEMRRLQDSLEQAKVKDELGVAMVNDLNAKAHQAKNEAAEAMENLDEMKLQLEIKHSELMKAQTSVAAAEAEMNESIERIAKLEEELSHTKQKLADADTQLLEAQSENTAISGRLAKAQEDLKVVREIQAEMLKLEENQRAADARMQHQKDEIMEKEELIQQLQSDITAKNASMRMQEDTIRRLEDQTDSLRKNVETALYEKTQTESALRSEIDRLRALKGLETPIIQETEVNIVAVAQQADSEGSQADMPDFIIPKEEKAEVPKPRRGRPPKQKTSDEEMLPDNSSEQKESVATDSGNDLDLLDATDWLVATPPEEPKPKRQRKQKAQSADDSFGYKEPERQDPPDNPAQMLLW